MGLFIALLWSGSASASPPVQGTWVLADDADTIATTHAEALERGLEQLPWAFRPFARPQLEKAVNNCGTLTLAIEGAEFRATCDDKPTFTRTIGDPSPHVGDNGDPFDVDVVVGSDTVQLAFVGAQGGQRTTYTPQADGTMVLTKTLTSHHLSGPIEWSVLYRPRD